MTRDGALRWAEQWVADWNARDLAAVLAHFEDGVEFTSPRALAAIGSLRFTLRRISWDPDTSELAIFYDRDVDGRCDRAAEVLQFGRSGRVARAEVYHGLLP